MVHGMDSFFISRWINFLGAVPETSKESRRGKVLSANPRNCLQILQNIPRLCQENDEAIT
jgi:hypothetical protein